MPNPLSDKVRVYRKRQGLTLKRLALEAGYSEPYVCRIENGHSAPTDRLLLDRLSKALHLSNEEHYEFITAAEESKRILHLPIDLMSDGYRVAHHFIGAISFLDSETLQTIDRCIANALNRSEKIRKGE